MKRFVLTGALVVLGGLAVTAQRGEILEQVLVKVNGDVITKTELEQRQIGALRQRDPNFRPGTDAELQKALAEVTPDVIVNAIDEMLLVQRGRELGYALGTEQFQSIIDNIKKENQIETEEQFQAALKQEGLSLDDLRRQIERQMLVSRVQQVEVAGKISVSEDDVKKYYEEHRDSFTTQPQLTLREILIAVQTTDKGVNVAADDAARAKAEDILERLESGEPFAQLASEVSESGSKANGGLIGPIARTDLSPELLKEIDPLKVGELTRVLRTTRGYQIIELESRTEQKVKTLDEARPEIADRLAADKQRGHMLQYLQQLRTQAIIDWKNDEIKKAYDLGVKQQQSDVP
ncbi:MAG TPA: peptidyl-prolyl cis-trans isomerase [Vicinamibacterales bacterium]|nr:peptidyl-prolyl cis-trans isomerase [Vicinamibacterales bacterium]